jgi:Uma2 family endonuclease
MPSAAHGPDGGPYPRAPACGYTSVMAIPVAKRRYTVAEYLELERASDVRHEFHNGEILAMAGGTIRHALVVTNVSGSLWGKLTGKPCRTYGSELKIGIPSDFRFVYPDDSIICGDPVPDPNDPRGESAINPKVVIEVLSPTTEKYDRTKKFEYYRSLDSLEEYVLIASDEPRIETFFRQEDGTWAFQSWTGLDAQVKLRAVPVTLAAGDVYTGVTFEPIPEPVDPRESRG